MQVKDKIIKIKTFISVDIWKRHDEKGLKGFFIKALKIILITVKEFEKDQITLKSSALTYLSILSIVPLVAMIFGISKGFGLAINIQEEISKLVPGQELVLNTTFEFAQNMLDNAKGGVIAGVSIGFLMYTVMKLLNNIEDVFNSIWGKQTARSWIRKFTDYLAILTVAPILIVLSSSATVYLETQMKTVGEMLEVEYVIAPIAVFFVGLSPYVLIWLLYTMIYIIMPNTKVNLKAGVLAGVIAGTVFQLVQWGFINFSVGMAKYNAIYGSLAALPLFLIFTQLSWTIVFVGGELSYAIQYVDDFIPDEKDIKFSLTERKKIALLVMRNIVKAFENGDMPFSRARLSQELNIPHRFISNAVDRLVDSGVLIKSLCEEDADHVYLPAIDINKIDIHFVVSKLETSGEGDLFTKDNPDFETLKLSLSEMNEIATKSNPNKLLKDL